MKKFDRAFEEKLEHVIAAIEEKTSVEVVAAVTPRSDSYIDAFLKGGLIFLLAMLLFVFYSPVFFPEALVPVDLAAAFVIGVLAVWLIPPFKRLLVSDRRMERYVNAGAAAFFMENNLDKTTARTAFLVYISVFERKCRLIGDRGVLHALPAGVWKEIEANSQGIFSRGNLPQAILDVLPTVTQPFSEFLPPAEDNIDELPNRLRRVER
jgi:uncharacterized membrane protein